MISWFFIFIPVVAAALVLIFFFKKIVWWELVLLIAPSALIILLMNTIMVAYRTGDTEYLGSYTKRVIYYQAWDEEVPCRHPVYCTRTYECGTSKEPRTCTESYVCGYEHAYDVDYHPEHWTKENNSGNEYSISQSEYNILKNRFATKTYFVELHRDYHSIDGDAYYTDWGGEPEKSDAMTSEGSYTNKIKVSHSIFKFEDIDEKTKKLWSLYDYPSVSGYYQSNVLGYKVDEITNRKMQYLNGFYGSSKQFRTYILFFRNQSPEVAYKQRSYWEGGNKNEFIICIGLDNLGKFDWVKCFSWMDKPELEVEVQDYFNINKDLNLSKFADWMPKQIEQHWHRKPFKDFDYLEIELTDTQMWWILIIVTLYNIGVSIWIVVNEFNPENDSKEKNDPFRKQLSEDNSIIQRFEEIKKTLMQRIRSKFFND
jgi:hypothetical protein